MITTASALTLSLAKAFGVYMFAAGLTGFMSRDKWGEILDGFRANAALTYISGVFVFVLGVTIILVHNIWSDPLTGFMSLVGWGAAIEGIVLIVFPKPLLDFAASMLRPGLITGFSMFVTILGALLFIAGMTGTVG